MKSNQKRFKLSRRTLVWSILVALFVIAGGLWAVVTFMPRPLGDKVEYLGKRDYGSYFFADAKPYTKYFYETDMSIEEIEKYFTKAHLESTGSYANSGDYRTQFLEFTIHGKTFTISFYNDAHAVTESLDLQKTKKKYLIAVTSYDYETAKEAL